MSYERGPRAHCITYAVNAIKIIDNNDFDCMYATINMEEYVLSLKN